MMTGGQRIRQARVAAQLSMRALAEQVGVTHTAIAKYEHGSATPRLAVIVRLARALNVPADFFFRTTGVSLSIPQYRKGSRVPAGVLKAAEAAVAILLELQLFLDSLYSPDATVDVETTDLSPVYALGDAETAAESLRKKWELGLDPVRSVTSTLEDKGVKVIPLPADVCPDGFSCWANETVPVIAYRAGMPGDRQRFTLAHELGHLLVDCPDSLDGEKVAHRFAGAFLAPRDAVARRLGQRRSRLDLDELLALKYEYGLSIQAWLRRAFDLEIITQESYRSWCRRINQLGWRGEEPGDQLPEELPCRFVSLLRRAVSEDLLTPAAADQLTRTWAVQVRKSVSPETLCLAAESAADDYIADPESRVFADADLGDIGE